MCFSELHTCNNISNYSSVGLLLFLFIIYFWRKNPNGKLEYFPFCLTLLQISGSQTFLKFRLYGPQKFFSIIHGPLFLSTNFGLAAKRRSGVARAGLRGGYSPGAPRERKSLLMASSKKRPLRFRI